MNVRIHLPADLASSHKYIVNPKCNISFILRLEWSQKGLAGG
jgi:hypothetical protein